MSLIFPNSTAIQEISNVAENQVTVTWKSGSSYTYNLSNPDKFIMDLNEVVSSSASVGSFVNSQIQQNMMQLV